MSTTPADDAVQAEHEACDGCICDTDPSEYPETFDHDLPPAKGGVKGDRKPKVERDTTNA